jgi:hypothetical protein
MSCTISYQPQLESRTMQPIYLFGEPMKVKTRIGETLNLDGSYIKILIQDTWLYFQIISETKTTFSVIRLQPDNFIPNAFYVTDEKNKFHGLINDGAFTKGRNIYLF